MSSITTTAAALVTMLRPSTPTQSESAVPDAVQHDPQQLAKLLQLQMHLNRSIGALERQHRASALLVSQQAASQKYAQGVAAQLGQEVPSSTLGPQGTELMSHPDIVEELKKRKDKEASASNELDTSIDAAKRQNTELLRALGFLTFRDTREEGSDGGENPIIEQPDIDAGDLIWDSHSDFYAQIGQLIAALQENWLSKYQDAMKKFLEFYEKFSDALEQLKPEASGDKGDVKIDFKAFEDALAELMDEYGVPSGGLASFESKAAAEAFKETLGLPGFTVTQDGDKWVVIMDMTAVKQLHESVKDVGQVTWDSAKYNAWVSNKDSNVEQVKHVSKMLSEKLSEMTQKFDNIVKTLSATIDKITDADMSFVHGL